MVARSENETARDNVFYRFDFESSLQADLISKNLFNEEY